MFGKRYAVLAPKLLQECQASSLAAFGDRFTYRDSALRGDFSSYFFFLATKNLVLPEPLLYEKLKFSAASGRKLVGFFLKKNDSTATYWIESEQFRYVSKALYSCWRFSHRSSGPGFRSRRPRVLSNHQVLNGCISTARRFYLEIVDG